MFISTLELFKIGIGPSSSHTMGPMVAAWEFIHLVKKHYLTHEVSSNRTIRCTLKGSLSATGKGHATDCAVALGLNNYLPKDVVKQDLDTLVDNIWKKTSIKIVNNYSVKFTASVDIIFDTYKPLSEHPNGMVFELIDENKQVLLSETYFSIGGGFINTLADIKQLVAPLKMKPLNSVPYAFDSAQLMMDMSISSGLSIAEMKRRNETILISEESLNQGLDLIWDGMKRCIEKGLIAEGILPGGLNIPRRAKELHEQLLGDPNNIDVNDWLCAYAMAVNEENAAGHMVVTAPTNGAAGVIPAILIILSLMKAERYNKYVSSY